MKQATVSEVNGGLTKRASMSFSRRGVYYTVEATSNMQNVNDQLPRMEETVIRWKTRSRLTGTQLTDTQQFQKELAHVNEMATMSHDEVNRALVLRKESLANFAKEFCLSAD